MRFPQKNILMGDNNYFTQWNKSDKFHEHGQSLVSNLFIPIDISKLIYVSFYKIVSISNEVKELHPCR